MDAYSIVERNQETFLQSGALPKLMNQEGSGERGKGLSIVDSARRDLEATLQLLADRAQYITAATGAAIALRDKDRILCRASTGAAAPELGASLDLSSGLSGESVRTRMSLRCDDVATDARVDRESCRRLGIASFAVVPIIRKTEVIGIFEVFANKPRVFQERDIAALERLREMVNIALDEASPERAKASSFAVHGPKVKALAAAAGVVSGPSATIAKSSRPAVDTQSTAFLAGLPGSSNRSTETVQALDRINGCKRCGFPVSEGRLLCLDCEEKGVPASDTVFTAAAGSSSVGIKSWMMTNRYIIGMVLISAATIAFALLH